MITASEITQHFKADDMIRKETIGFLDELIINEQASIEFLRDNLNYHIEKLNSIILDQTTETNIKIEYCEKRIELFRSMQDRQRGKEVVLEILTNPLFPKPVEEKKTLLFGRKKK